MLDFCRASSVVEPDGYSVKSIRLILEFVLAQVNKGDFCQLMKLLTGDVLFRQSFPVPGVFTGFHFNKNDFFVLFGNYVDFSYSAASRVAIIHGEYRKTLRAKIIGRDLLTNAASLRFFLHHRFVLVVV